MVRIKIVEQIESTPPFGVVFAAGTSQDIARQGRHKEHSGSATQSFQHFSSLHNHKT
jgi:hypothetical protein